MEKRLNTVAHNVANSKTVGFRAEGTQFDTILSRAAEKPVSFVKQGGVHFSRQTGPIVKTGNLLDVAIQGQAWLAVKNAGRTIYTRDGRMQMTPTGDLQTLKGYPVLDVGGSPLQLNVKDGPPKISRDGMITQSGKQVGALGLFEIPENAVLTRADNSGVFSDQEATPVIEFTENGVVQGFVEESNVNAMTEIARLVEITRSFESLNSMVRQLERTSIDAIKTLGSGQ